MKPIPISLLPHSVICITDIVTDAFDGEISRRETEMRRVRIEPRKTLGISRDNLKKGWDATLYYDVKNSRPAYSFAVGDRISFAGATYVAVSVKPFYDCRNLHHFEIGLRL